MKREPIPYYPDLPCHAAPLRQRDPVPKDGCACALCENYHRPPERWVPVVLSREPFHGELRRESTYTVGESGPELFTPATAGYIIRRPT